MIHNHTIPRQADTRKQTDRQKKTDRQADTRKQTGRHKKTGRQAQENRQTDTRKHDTQSHNPKTGRHKKTDRQTDTRKQTDMQTQENRQAGTRKQAGRHKKTDRQTQENRQAGRHPGGGRKKFSEATAKAIPAEDVKLKDRDVVIAGEVDGGLEGHGFQRRANGVSLVQGVAELLPRHDDPAKHTHCFKTHQLYITTICKLIH